MSGESTLWRWHYYWWATETFDRSLPHHAAKHSSALFVRPMEGWPSIASSRFARELRSWLSLTEATVHGANRLHMSALRDLLVRRWVHVVEKACVAGDYDGLADFGIQVSRHALGVFKFGWSLASVSVTELASAVGFEPDQCAHLHVVEREFTAPSGVCLRCCTIRPSNEVTSRPNRSTGTLFHEPVAVPQIRLSQPYAHHPGDRDRFPLGQAPGDATVFAAYLGGLRGGS